MGSIEQMENAELALPDTAVARPDVTSQLTRGVARLFSDMGYASLLEFRLPNGRRADIAALDAKGRLIIAEVKSCEADFTADHKWSDYLGFCDAFYFAVGEDFPRVLLPENEGLIIADGFGAAIVRNGEEKPIAPARRKALTLKFARQAASRMLIMRQALPA